MEGNKPERCFRAGGITATVWSNEGVGKDGHPRSFPSVSFERRYKDKSGAWKSTNSLSTTDLPKAIVVLGKAFEYLALRGKEEAQASSYA